MKPISEIVCNDFTQQGLTENNSYTLNKFVNKVLCLIKKITGLCLDATPNDKLIYNYFFKKIINKIKERLKDHFS